MHKWLQECRDSFGDAPRSFGLWDRLTYLRVPRPRWCTGNDALIQFFRGKDRLLREGFIVWGHLIQANSLLFQPGPHDHPGEVVYCPDPSRDIDPSALADVATRLFALKGTAPERGDLAAIATYLTDERIRVFGLSVPNSLGPRLGFAISTVFFRRQHLPARMLCAPILPLLVSPEQPRLAMVLPSQYWPDELVDWWAGG